MTDRRRDNPLVTVATVAFNSAPFIAEAIDSILAQDFPDFELLVCDDGSTDDTWQIVQRYADPRIRAIRNERNLGEYANRNQALRLARGRYILYIDGDDCLYPHGLGFMARALERFPGAAFASAQPPCDKFEYPVELAPREFLSCIFLGPTVIGANFTQLLFRTESLRACGGFDPRFRTGDTHIQLVMGMRQTCLLIGGGLAWWRNRPGQASLALHRDHWGVAEMTRYGIEILEHPLCPLAAEEKRSARKNLVRTMMRALAACSRRGRLLHALRLARYAGVRLGDCGLLFTRQSRPYLRDVSGANPVRSSDRA
jgi:hypothetical protein